MYHANSPAKYFQLNGRFLKSTIENKGLIVRVSKNISRTCWPLGEVSKPSSLHLVRVSKKASDADETPDFFSNFGDISVIVSIIYFYCKFIKYFTIVNCAMKRFDFLFFVFKSA